MKMNKIQTVFVDCDGVLYDVDFLAYSEIENAGRRAGEALGLDWTNFKKVHKDLKKKGFRGFYNTVLELCRTHGVSFEKLAQDMVDILDYSRIQPNPKLLTYLQQVSQMRKLFIFTNNTRPHLEKIFNRLFGCTIDQSRLAVITAENTLENGYFYTKKMTGVFSKWCQKIKTTPERTLMLDDSEDVIEAAKKEGLQFIKIENADMTEKVLKNLNKIENNLLNIMKRNSNLESAKKRSLWKNNSLNR